MPGARRTTAPPLLERIDAQGEKVLKLARVLIWNSILGLLVLVFANAVFSLGIPYLSWPLLLTVVFGVPGALAAILVWVLLL